MLWFTANWFWVVIFIAFGAMHLFGHGSHGVIAVIVKVIVHEARMTETQTTREVAA